MGRLGPLKVVGLVLWQLRFTFLAMTVVIVALLPVPDASQSEYAAAVLSVLGIGASVFIGFRNTTAYNRWWEARTLWGGIIINSRTLSYGLTSVDTGSPEVAATLDRMRRRQARYCWTLAAEMRRIPPADGGSELTPEDPPGTDSVALLDRQAADIASLSAGGHIDNQARVLLMTSNAGTAAAQSGLERIRNEPVPIHYDLFIRGLAWFFGIMAFSRLDSTTHPPSSVIIGALLMATFLVAERLGHFIEEPMNNSVFDIPMSRICATITANLLGPRHPLATPPQDDTALVWM